MNTGLSRLKYTDIKHAPEWHREAAHLLVMEFSVQDAARCLDVSVQSIDEILTHGPFLEHCRSLRARIALETRKQHDRLNKVFGDGIGLLEKSIGKMSERLDGADLSLDEIMLAFGGGLKSVNEIADRLPGRAFMKVSRTEAKTFGVLISNKQPASDPAAERLNDRMRTLLNGPPASALPIEFENPTDEEFA